jgi:hypothetical protein
VFDVSKMGGLIGDIRPNDLGDMVILDNCSRIELRLMPLVLLQKTFSADRRAAPPAREVRFRISRGKTIRTFAKRRLNHGEIYGAMELALECKHIPSRDAARSWLRTKCNVAVID